MATVRTRFVDPGVVGGDGNGQGSFANAYATWASANAAESAAQGDITAATGSDEIVIFEFRSSNSTADNTAVLVTGWTTAADNYILCRAHADHRADGKYGNVATSYRHEMTETMNNEIHEDFVRYDGLQFKLTRSADAYMSVLLINGQSAINNHIMIDKCFVTCDEAGATVKTIGISGIDVDSIVTVRNTIVDLPSRRGISAGGHGGTWKIYNCTIAHISALDGIYATDECTMTVKNCAVFDTADDFDGPDTIDYCASDDGDGDHAVAPSGGDWPNEFTDPGNGDYRILNTGNCYQAGESHTNDGDVPTDDIADNPRTDGQESIGAFEYVAEGVTENLSGTLAAAGSLSGSLKARRSLSGSVAAESAISATLNAKRFLSGSISAVSSITGDLAGGIPLSGSVAAASGVSGRLRVKRYLSGSIAAESAIVGNINRIRGLSGSVAAQSTVSGRLKDYPFLYGTLSITVCESILAIEQTESLLAVT